MRRHCSTLAVLFAATVPASGCYSGLDTAGGAAADDTTAASAASNASMGTGESDAGSTGDGEPGEEVDEPTLRRLTRAELGHALVDLLGPVTLEAVEADSEQEGFFAVGAARVALSPAGVASYESALDAATTEAFADPAHLATIVACVPTSADDSACIRESIAAFGRRAWRRPLADDELQRYVDVAAAVATETGDGVIGLRHALWGVLQSPWFLYRVELGTPSEDDGGRVKFSSWEMASRLSFTLWSSVPDDALLDAAQGDALATPEGIAAQAERMLADPRAHQGVENFIAELYGLWGLDEKTKDPELYPAWTPSLKTTMRSELLARVDDVVFGEPDDFFSLYDGKKVFVDNELAALYGLPAATPDAFRAELLPEDDPRQGLIGSAVVLAMNSLPARTSATKRGQFIAETLLCRTVPPPPPNVDVNLDDDDTGDGQPHTLRELLEPHRANAQCAACHNLTDPLGLALEHYDTSGAWRDTDRGLTIDASGELDGVPFTDAAELAVLLREHPDAASCLVSKLYTYTSGRLPFASEQDALDTVEADFAGADNHFDRLLHALVTHDDFRFANPAGTVIAAAQEMP
jgi:Protein of unknown function (DUF1592)/Protein of unknown function (DUF1588)/Protein of unknown function (DUF1595)/Protein of unknown function (DUF1585)/Protein of unknown function (DUF1587)